MSKKTTKKFNATKRTHEDLAVLGAISETVEKKVPYSFITQDLFGMIDILALHPSKGFVGIQSTAGGHGPARINKILTEVRRRAYLWLKCGGVLEVWDYQHKSSTARGRKIYVPRIAQFYIVSGPVSVYGDDEEDIDVTDWRTISEAWSQCIQKPAHTKLSID